MKYVFKKKALLTLIPVLDAIGSVLFFPVRSLRRRGVPEIKRILLVRCDHIGDVVAASAVTGPVRESFPDAAIDFLVSSPASDILRNDPHLGRVITFDPPWFDRASSGILSQLRGIRKMAAIMKGGGYDLVVDFRGDLRHIIAMFLAGAKARIGYGITGGGFLLTREIPYEGRMHEVERNMELLSAVGIENKALATGLHFSDEDRQAAEELLREEGVDHGRYAVLHVVPGHDTKVWGGEKFARVARYLFSEKGLVPVAVGASKDTEEVKRIAGLAGQAEIVDVTGKTPLGALYHIMSGADLFIGVDSGPAHIAAAAGIPAVVLFSGINDPFQWAPRGEKVKLVYPGQGKKLTEVQPDQVCAAIDEVLG